MPVVLSTFDRAVIASNSSIQQNLSISWIHSEDPVPAVTPTPNHHDSQATGENTLEIFLVLGCSALLCISCSVYLYCK